MQYWKQVVMLAIFFCCGVMLSAAAIDEFKEALAKVEEDTGPISVIESFKTRLSSVDDLRILQSYWMQVDPESCRKHFMDLQRDNPQAPEYKYLILRYEEDPELQMDGAILLCKNHPDFYWGYRLFIVNYLEWLTNAMKEEDNPLAGEDYKLQIVDAGIKRFPDDAFLNLFQFHRYQLFAEDAKAKAVLLSITDNNVIGSNWRAINDYLVKSRDLELVENMMGKFTGFAISRGTIEAADSLSYHHFGRAEMFTQWKDWPALEKFFSEHPDYLKDPNFVNLQELMLLDMKRYPELVASLAARYESGQMKYPDLSGNADYAVLEGDAAWNELLHKAQTTWDNALPERRAKALEDRIGTPAPLWELPDADGTIIKLQNLKGDVIVLDFWATWCGPCQMAMPALDKWMKHDMPKGTKVFSINLWDKGNADKARQLFKDEGYAMTLLFAEDTLSKDYGFQGIPYICVIDKEGRIAFAQSGYSPTLEENLSFWVDALIQE